VIAELGIGRMNPDELLRMAICPVCGERMQNVEGILFADCCYNFGNNKKENTDTMEKYAKL